MFVSQRDMVVELIEGAVRDNLAKHSGDMPAYFSSLDGWIKTLLYSLIRELYPPLMLMEENYIPYNVIVSGRFGRAFVNICNALNIRFKSLIVVNGDLREFGAIADDLTYLYGVGKTYRHEKFHFIDDSYHCGKTRQAVSDALRAVGARLIMTYVVYDGARERDPRVMSLFRYFDWEGRHEGANCGR